MQEKLYWIWLSKVKGLGPHRMKKLLDYFNDAQGIWRANREELSNVDGIGKSTSQKIISSKARFDFDVEYKKINKFNVKVVTLTDKCYPKLLKEIYDSPPILYYRGDLSKINRPCIAIVGSRKCTNYGKQVAKRLGQRLAEKGIPIVSGMARGIDTSAHKGALQRGITYAVWGSGLDITYPPENDKLAADIIEDGAIITSFPLGTKPHGNNFPVRNRIISGLSLGTIVVEATQKSGSLITANLALEQGREVFAIPGDITKKQSVGTNSLIQVGAKLVQSIDDILEELPLKDITDNLTKNEVIEKDSNNLSNLKAKKQEIIEELTKDQKKVYQALSSNPKQFESLANNIKLDSAQLNSILLKLELKGLIDKLPGRKFKIAN